VKKPISKSKLQLDLHFQGVAELQAKADVMNVLLSKEKELQQFLYV
jgi:hypothetical protein